MAIEINSAEKVVCTKCGTAFGRRKGYFPVSYAMLHKGIGYIPVCKECIDGIYNDYLAQCKDAASAVRQTCRKLDLYWNSGVYDIVSRKSTTKTMMTQYIAKINTVNYAGKSYDSTLLEEGYLWDFPGSSSYNENDSNNNNNENTHVDADKESLTQIYEKNAEQEEIKVEDSVIEFWGSGYAPSMYAELEKKFNYYKSGLPKDSNIDIGTEMLLKQACVLEVIIARDSAQGKSIDKSVGALNTILGSLNIKPVQKQDDSDAAELSSTPLGVWLYRYENKRPLPEIDDDLKDVNGIKKYVFIWLGHLCKMLGKKNGFERLYEEEISKYRVERPEFSGESDEELYMDILAETEAIDI